MSRSLSGLLWAKTRPLASARWSAATVFGLLSANFCVTGNPTSGKRSYSPENRSNTDRSPPCACTTERSGSGMHAASTPPRNTVGAMSGTPMHGVADRFVVEPLLVQDIVEDQIAGSADGDDRDLLADEVFGRLDRRIVLDHEQRLPLGAAVGLAQRHARGCLGWWQAGTLSRSRRRCRNRRR